jgi:hypothetical protein
VSPLQQAPHLLALFRQLDDVGRMGLVHRMREQALQLLAGHAPAGFDADDNDHCVTAALWIEASTAPADVKAAARLLRACVRAVEAPGALDAAQLVATYALLDEDAVARGKPFQGKGKRPDAVGRWLDAALLRDPKATPADLWAMLVKKPPRGYVVEADSFGGTLYRRKSWTEVCTRAYWRERVRRARERTSAANE